MVRDWLTDLLESVVESATCCATPDPVDILMALEEDALADGEPNVAGHRARLYSGE
jgi:hypothetical protein